MIESTESGLKAVFFDYGGVLAEEGFREGLADIARAEGIEERRAIEAGERLIHETGYLYGRRSEAGFWESFRRRLGDRELGGMILERFTLRPRVLERAESVRRSGLLTAILSDQTDWLDRLEARDGFFHLFDRVFNSYHLGLGKGQEAVFPLACRLAGVEPEEVLFIDDRGHNVERASSSSGMKTLLFTSEEEFLEAFDSIFPGGSESEVR